MAAIGSVTRALSGAILLSAVGTCFAQATQFGNWTLYRHTDPITDEDRSTIGAMADDLAGYPHRAWLLVRCTSDSAYPGALVFFNADADVGASSFVKVVYRFDAEEPVTDAWMVSENRELVFLFPAETAAFLESLAATGRFAIRVNPDRSSELTYTVTTSGFAQALEALGCFTKEL